jgi:hypothetical protein
VQESDDVKGLVPKELEIQLQPVEASGLAFELMQDVHLSAWLHAEHSGWQAWQELELDNGELP